MRMNDVEIIEFFKPLENSKNLFVRNIVLHSSAPEPEQIITHRLHKIFSTFGLLYEVQVLPCIDCKFGQESTSNDSSKELEHLNFYAFVKFYSSMSAEKARNSLHLTHFVGIKASQVTYAKRKKTGSEKQLLFVTQCYELANYYLGFNGWSSSTQKMDKQKTNDKDICCYECAVDLIILNYGLNINGKGTSEVKICETDPVSKITAHARCKKQAYQSAVQMAFSKVILVVLGNGKVHVQLNTSVPEEVEEFHPLFSCVTVNELDKEPELSNEEDLHDTLDEENINILMELENDMSQ